MLLTYRILINFFIGQLLNFFLWHCHILFLLIAFSFELKCKMILVIISLILY